MLAHLADEDRPRHHRLPLAARDIQVEQDEHRLLSRISSAGAAG
jgi:hypothetical protein